MRIGVPRETYAGEKRVATTPDMAAQLIKLGFEVAVESNACSVGFTSDPFPRCHWLANLGMIFCSEPGTPLKNGNAKPIAAAPSIIPNGMNRILRTNDIRTF